MGIVMSVSETSGWVFGWNPATLVGRPIACFIDVMRQSGSGSVARAAALLTSRSSLASVFEGVDLNQQTITSLSTSTPGPALAVQPAGGNLEEVSVQWKGVTGSGVVVWLVAVGHGRLKWYNFQFVGQR